MHANMLDNETNQEPSKFEGKPLITLGAAGKKRAQARGYHPGPANNGISQRQKALVQGK